MNTLIEIHDSTVSDISTIGRDIIITFKPAYLHKSLGQPGSDPGTGWVQEASLTLRNATQTGSIAELPCYLMTGELRLKTEFYDNILPVPLPDQGPAILKLKFDQIHTLSIRSHSIHLEMIGEPKYVEEFPGMTDKE